MTKSNRWWPKTTKKWLEITPDDPKRQKKQSVTDGRTDGRTDVPTDSARCRVARPRLEMPSGRTKRMTSYVIPKRRNARVVALEKSSSIFRRKRASFDVSHYVRWSVCLMPRPSLGICDCDYQAHIHVADLCNVQKCSTAATQEPNIETNFSHSALLCFRPLFYSWRKCD